VARVTGDVQAELSPDGVERTLDLALVGAVIRAHRLPADAAACTRGAPLAGAARLGAGDHDASAA